MILICASCKKRAAPEWKMAHSGAEIFFLSLKNFLLCVLQRCFCWLALFSENIPLVPQVGWEGKGCFMVNEETSSRTAFHNQNPSTLHVCRLTFALSACWTQFSWGLNCKQKLLCLFCFHAIPILITPFSFVQRQILTKKHDLTIYGPFSPHWKHHLVVVCGHLALILVHPASLPLEPVQETVCCLSPEGADPFHLRTITLFFCLCDMMIFHCLAALEIEKQ